jgi:Flp pilus assembly protein TadG
MWATDRRSHSPRQRPGTRQDGVAAVEFALLATVFFMLLFGVLEVARAIYLYNTLQEVTRRAASMAANSRFDSASLDTIRKQALFADANGNLALGEPVTPAHLKIDYLSLSRDSTGVLTAQPTSPMPSCPATNMLNCLTNPYGASCIRLVRVRVCDPNGTDECSAVPYKMLFPLVDLSLLKLPRSETVVPAQSLGYTGSVPCP